MKKIIYAMNVDWGWIKQRPHFIAEGLTECFNVKVCYQYRYKRKKLQKNTTNKKIELMPIKAIPFISRFEYLRFINDAIVNLKIKKLIIKEKPDILFITYPTQNKIIPKNYKGQIIYDCMDNHEAFYSSKSVKKFLKTKEKNLIKLCDYVLFSSQYLKNEISQRYHIEEAKTLLVRNAYDGNIIKCDNDIYDNTTIKLAYIGTISNWFDWETISYCVKYKQNVEIHLFGPIDKTELITNSKIIYHGVVEHSKLYEYVKCMDILIMPFILNEIIAAVDPVKVYEYINFNKNIIMREYLEVQRLKEFVYFYNNAQEFVNAIDEIEKNKIIKYSNENRVSFLSSNNWNNRVEQIKRILE